MFRNEVQVAVAIAVLDGCRRVAASWHTWGVIFCRALRVWCMDMISLPHSSVLNAQKSTTCQQSKHFGASKRAVVHV